MKRVLAAVLAVLPSVAFAQGSTPQPSVLVTTATPHEGSLGRTLTAYGVVQAAPGSSETLSLLRAGQVTRILVAAGQTVRKGQPLLLVSADPAALATYRQAVTALTLAQGERGRVAQMPGTSSRKPTRPSRTRKVTSTFSPGQAGAAPGKRSQPRSTALSPACLWQPEHASHPRRR